ncbi:MAG: glycosyltransferase [Acidimicrobiaceae bacterium]|nr:glycosyltransferase [Acidimicrobiaceae bacterium]MXZ65407.1 glycosyltransferase [Acidimicrobiaceae bacterium]MYF34372.1 glycosyltransferase [Acidimicrobiaceae bacterium]MYG78980.1 glycosyltransferase [Acidimicrobiaceae bacterium]MYJ82974.1 glycosyltransferase [Acidimicrobiaceae bacterium]
MARGRAVHGSHPTIVGVLRPRQADPSAGPEAGAALRAEPPPACVRGNDWRSLPVPPVEEFEPSRSVSVIVPYYEAPEALALTLAGLQLQTYPQELFDVIVVDDGSSTPLHLEAATPLRVKVIHQPDEGFGAARARNNGARAAAGEILVFLDCDMVPEAGWLRAHARWHHAASDVLTLGFRKHVSVDGISADAVRARTGSLGELFEGRQTEEPQWLESRMARTDLLTTGDEDIFRAVTSGNLGVSAQFFAAAGGFDETFNQWGAEDQEFGYRAFALGAVLVPDRDALCWHQGPGARISDAERLSLAQMQGKLMNLIPHGRPREATGGRSFTVPRFAVSVTSSGADQQETLETVHQVLASKTGDLMVWVEEHPGGGLEWLHNHLDPDHRVRFGPVGGAAAAFGAARFHITIPAGAPVGSFMVGRLRTQLGSTAAGRARLKSGHRVTITRSWALQRALRCGVRVEDLGDVIDIDGWTLEAAPQPSAPSAAASAGSPRGSRVAALGARSVRYARALLGRAARVRNPRDVWRLLTWLVQAVRRRTRVRRAMQPPAGIDLSTLARYPLGAEIAAAGDRASAVLAASARVGAPAGDRHLDLVLVDTDTARRALEPDATGPSSPAVAVLDELHPRLSVPAFDTSAVNPVDWTPDHDQASAPLASRWQPPSTGPASLYLNRDVIDSLRRLHHVEDSGTGLGDTAQRAGVLAALAAAGVLVHVTDSDAALEACLGAELHTLMTSDSVTGVQTHAREQLSIAMRRLALRDHSLRARARQLLETRGLEAPHPLVSVLLPTRRPELLEAALDAVRVQNYPQLELVLALHGDGFESDARLAAMTAPLGCDVRVVRVTEDKTLGEVLNAAVAASSGTLLTKFDDDDYYGADHIWDLLLARQYSGATLVAKAAEYVYLSRLDRTVRVSKMRERFVPHPVVSGGVLMISRQDLDAAGGWRRVPRSVDISLARDVVQVGGDIYWTHGTGYLRVRHGDEHTWTIDDDFFLGRSDDMRPGRDFEFAGF